MFAREVVKIICDLMEVERSDVFSERRDTKVVAIRKIICAICVEYKVPHSELAMLFGYTKAGILRLLHSHKSSITALDTYGQRYAYEYQTASDAVFRQLIQPSIEKAAEAAKRSRS